MVHANTNVSQYGTRLCRFKGSTGWMDILIGERTGQIRHSLQYSEQAIIQSYSRLQVHPGSIDTPFVDGVRAQISDTNIRPSAPIGRLGVGAEVAQVYCFTN